jgi:hypothetical protein
LKGAKLVSSDKDVLTIDDANVAKGVVHVKGAGQAEVRVEKDGKLIDAVGLRSGKAKVTTLVDAAVLSATENIDARLPKEFALQSGKKASLLVAAVDGCGGELLDMHASTLVAEGVQATVESPGPASFTVEPAEKGELTLTLQTPGIDDLAYDVSVVVGDDVDEVEVAVATTDGESTALVWGRAFANDVELVGTHSFAFDHSERVSLSGTNDLVSNATISYPESGQPADERPALVSIELFGEEDEVDLLTLTEGELKASRGKAPREAPEPKQSLAGGCSGEGGSCALLLVVGAGPLRSLRRLSKRRFGPGGRAAA